MYKKLNVMSRNKHISEIERYIRTIKERARAIANSLPFTKAYIRNGVQCCVVA